MLIVALQSMRFKLMWPKMSTAMINRSQTKNQNFNAMLTLLTFTSLVLRGVANCNLEDIPSAQK